MRDCSYHLNYDIVEPLRQSPDARTRPAQIVDSKLNSESVVRLSAFIIVFTICLTANAGDLPDPLHTPGAVDPAVTQDNIDRTICVPGYTRTVRPPAAYTNRIKREELDSYYKG